MMKILHLIDSYSIGGCEKMLEATAYGLQHNGKTDNVICLISNKFDIIEDRGFVKIKKIKILKSTNHLFRSIFRFCSFPMVFKTILDEKPDIIYVYHATEDSLMCSILGKLLGKKVSLRKSYMNNFLTPLGLALNKISFRICDNVVTLSPDSYMELIADGLQKRKISLIPNGKKAENYVSNLSKEAARKKFDLPEKGFVIGIVSRLDPGKGHITLIEAFPEILKVKSNAVLLFTDDGHDTLYRKKIIEHAKALGIEEKIVLIDYQENVSDILKALDLFVHPSFTDSLPGSVLEAMCAGLPIIASDVGGTPFLLESSGILVPPGDKSLLAKFVNEMISNPRMMELYSKRAQKRAVNNFSLERMLADYEDLFNKLVS